MLISGHVGDTVLLNCNGFTITEVLLGSDTKSLPSIMYPANPLLACHSNAYTLKYSRVSQYYMTFHFPHGCVCLILPQPFKIPLLVALYDSCHWHLPAC